MPIPGSVVQAPPQGSKITTELNEQGQHVLVLPDAKPSGPMRYFILAFMAFWLCGWAFGFVSVIGVLFGAVATKGWAAALGRNLFLLVWLGGWTVAGAFAIFWIRRMARRPVPERLIFARPNLLYDTGIPPFQFSFDMRSQFDAWKKLFEKRQLLTFSPSELKTLRLREVESGNRLTLDQGNARVEIAKGSTEVEREWIHRLLGEVYSLQSE